MVKISIIGSGYVGLVSGTCLADIGNKVICVDNNKEKIELLKTGKVPIYEPGLDKLIKKNAANKRLTFTTDLHDAVHKSDVIFIAVNTPSKENGDVDMSYVENVSREIATNMTEYKIIVSKSTVPVETGKKIKDAVNLYCKKHIKFDVVSNPEFLREGSAVKDFMKPDRVVIGSESENAKKIMDKIYRQIKAPILHTDIESAELIKHASNSFLALKISYINAVAQFCEKVGADVLQVAKGMGFDHRIGKDFLNAGVGFGGSCFPKDLSAFISIAGKDGYDFKLLKCVKEINYSQKVSFLEKIREALWTLNDKTVSILGLSFKPETDDMRESPSIFLINELIKEGAKVKVYDPVAMEKAKQVLPESVIFCKDPYDAVKDTHAMILLTEWKQFKKIDFHKVKKLLITPIIIDGRNFYDKEMLEHMKFIYKGVGR
ncbi:UDP-glucose dehydrogenase family protein [bacterium]